ncbi:zinc finger matrin-type protein 5 isoform X3 [Rhinatrema bivittatum]|uniref:zinc finger matrin-type protein 5 isoform X3 n=1 Tax=Rhinatrema bivittatum TaxID=194408 RepID=UPI001129C697|nr:zinc finger matrin-type protein 5 isoform X3 [Rhinatrema bivittatum]
MGKRYFCDYCDRSFQDNLHNRKKHLNGVQHQRCKKVWYDMFRDASTVLAEEKTKKPCRKFLQTGQCDFGSNCRFSHLSEKDIERLMSQVEEERKAKEHQEEKGDKASDCQIEDWLERRTKRKKSARNNRNLTVETTVFQFPPGWPSVHDLPPSLHPPPPSGWTVPSSLQWG